MNATVHLYLPTAPQLWALMTSRGARADGIDRSRRPSSAAALHATERPTSYAGPQRFKRLNKTRSRKKVTSTFNPPVECQR